MVFLVTGGAGFIGSHLCESLGKDALAFDDFSTGGNAGLLKTKGIGCVKGSITDKKALEGVFKDVETVFHLAAMNRAQRSIQKPLEANDVNVNGTLNVLEECRKNDCAIVFASSSSVYGGGEEKKREDSPLRPPHPYGVGKLAAEEYCRVYGELYGLKETRLRYVSVFGPRQRPDVEYAAVIPKFIHAVKNGKPVTIFGSGVQSRQFTFVKDTVDATVIACNSGKAWGNCFNVACPDATALLDLISLIEGLTKKKAKKEFLPKNLGEPLHNPIDVSKAKKVLGWQAKYSLRSALEETINSL